MNVQAGSQERREVLALARRYRRDGYKVSGPDERSAWAAFLGDLEPDLIAERDDDKVTVEVKRSAAVRGSNDIVQLAERVAAQPGWRFELIAIPKTSRIAMPDLARVDDDVRRLLAKGFASPAFIVVFDTIESLVAYATARQGRNPAHATFPALVRDLVVRGIIGEDTRGRIDDANTLRRTILHATMEPAPTRGEVEALLELGHELQREILSVGEAA